MKRRSSTRSQARRRLLRHRLLLQEKRLNRAGYKSIAGIDEAGRGPLAGPVVAGAVILKDFDLRTTVNDSKKLSSAQRERAYREILEKSVVGVGIVDEKTIDDINIYRATMKAMEIALANLSVPPDYILVDGNMKIRSRCGSRCIVSGDSKSLSIAAASIVAKVTRDRLMVEYDRVYPQYGFSRHKGYPTRAHKESLKAHGPSPIHRRSFRPVRDCLAK